MLLLLEVEVVDVLLLNLLGVLVLVLLLLVLSLLFCSLKETDVLMLSLAWSLLSFELAPITILAFALRLAPVPVTALGVLVAPLFNVLFNICWGSGCCGTVELLECRYMGVRARDEDMCSSLCRSGMMDGAASNV